MSIKEYSILSDYYKQECLLEKSLEILEYALQQHKDNVSLLVKKAELHLLKKESEICLLTLDKAETISPNELSIQLMRAEGLAALNMQEDAIALLDSLKPSESGSRLADILVCEALICEQMEEHERMFYLLKAALEEDPGNTEALSQMRFCVEQTQKHEESIEVHEAILEENPYCALAWYNLGAAQHYLCDYENAIQSYEYAFLTNEDFEFAYRDCAEVCLYVKDYTKALQCYQEVLDRFEPDTDLLLHIGICYLNLGKPTLAKSFFDKAAHSDPYSSEAQYGIAQCFAHQKDWRRAIDAYRKAIFLEDRQEEYYSAISHAYVQIGNYKKAEAYLRAAADIAPEEAKYWIDLARFLMQRNRASEALETLDEAEEYTYGSEILYCRSACLFILGRKKEGLLALEDALFEDFDSHKSLFNLVPLLEEDKEVKAVIATLKPDML